MVYPTFKKDSLTTTDRLTNELIQQQWPLNKGIHSPPHHMHVNVTTAAEKYSFSPPISHKSNSYNSYQRHESPFPYNSSLNYHYTATPPLDDYMNFYSQMTRTDDMDDDDFDLVRAKVTDITRTMQQYHVDELEQSSVDQLDNASTPPLSPLGILFPTTNSLVQSRLMEELNHLGEDQQQKWQTDFLDLMSTLITYSENLESLSVELLRAEGKVRELGLLQRSMLEEYEEREKLYQNRLDECQQVAQQQQHLMDHLVELERDLDLTTITNKTKPSNRRWTTLSATTSTTTTTTATTATTAITATTATTATTLPTIHHWQSSEQGQQPRNRRNTNDSYSSLSLLDQYRQQQQWNLNQPIGEVIHINLMEDLVSTLRWEVGLWIGGGVGSGHVIHSFEGPLNGIELIIAGSGTIATTTADVNELPSATTTSFGSFDDLFRKQESFTLSSSLQHLRFHRHHYMLHIDKHDRVSQFKLMPTSRWVPDRHTDQCQFKTATAACNTRFHLFQRKHHCRRCGIIVCQRHSLNRLPLFTSVESGEKWHRVCDGCFYDLIINKKQAANHDSAADLTDVC